MTNEASRGYNSSVRLRAPLLIILSLSSCQPGAERPAGQRPKKILPLALVQTIGSGNLKEPSAVRFLTDGSFLATEARGHRLSLYSSGGTLERSVGRFGEAPEHFDQPRSLALRPWKEPLTVLQSGLRPGATEDEIRAALQQKAGPLALVCDRASKLRILSSDLSALFSGLGFEDGETLRPWVADMDPQANLVVMEKDGWITKLSLSSLEGPRIQPEKILARFGGPGPFPGKFRDPQALMALPDGGILVADTGHGLVQRFSQDGKFLNSIGEPGYGAGGLIAPSDMALDSQGRVYVADLLNPLIEVFLPSGSYLHSLDPRAGAGPGCHPTALSLDKEGRLLLADRYRGRILIMRRAENP